MIRLFHSSTFSRQTLDAYKILNIPRSATKSDIKQAYYKLAKEFHPDTNDSPSAKATFVEMQAAYDTLKDEVKRAIHDQNTATSSSSTGHTAYRPGGGGGAGQSSAQANFYKAYNPYRPSSSKVKFDFDAHQFGHYGSKGSFMREERAFFRRVAAERAKHQRQDRNESMQVLGKILFSAGTLYILFMSGYVELIFR